MRWSEHPNCWAQAGVSPRVWVHTARGYWLLGHPCHSSRVEGQERKFKDMVTDKDCGCSVCHAQEDKCQSPLLSKKVNKKTNMAPSRASHTHAPLSRARPQPRLRTNVRFWVSVHNHNQDSRRLLRSRHLQNLETPNSLEQTMARSSTCVTHGASSYGAADRTRVSQSPGHTVAVAQDR